MSEEQDQTTGGTETRGFEAEAKQLLKLMIHSLYSNREVFLRELVSNASDAVDKLRFEALSHPEWLGEDSDLRIRLAFDKDARTLTIEDNGIGMNRQELIENLGTIARSGTARFLEQLTGDQQKDSQLIGQFGVGFYASFIVADRVAVETRRAGETEAWCWRSSGEADYELSPGTRTQRGTTITLHLKADASEFLEPYRVRSVIKKYADHIAIPVQLPEMEGDKPKEEEGDIQWETVNEAKALWTRPRKDIEEGEYNAFYQHLAHDFEDPLCYSHNRVEGKHEYTSLLYVPKRAPFDLYHRESPRGLKLYVRRVFIMDEAEQFLPLYLRFVRGVIDSADLPLNVSREILQQDERVEAIRGALTKRVLDMLEKLAKNDEAAYQTFWNELGPVLKEGPAEDFANKERVASLLRFASTKDDSSAETHSLDAYLERSPEGQTAIYYVTGDSFAAAKGSPHIEALRQRGVEVLLLSHRLDEWLMSHLSEYKGTPLKDVARGAIDLKELPAGEGAEKDAPETTTALAEDVLEGLQKALGERVKTVRVSDRLTDSPACLVVEEDEMGSQMRRLLKSAGQAVPEAAPILEVNGNHVLLRRFEQEQDGERRQDLAEVLLAQAKLAEGDPLDDPAAYLRCMNRLLAELA
ncbi:MAG: molecular chaperone HtpG [Pseudomonadota bacterium]|nr:molecular chaperone HtpG [Pseudomonadota bacterium]MED5443828.1 molecular chaperone HtpG [Pseudomonadota bacterium]